MTFDPWTASIEDAMRAQEAFDEKKASSPTDPIFQFLAAMKIEEKKPAVEADDGFAVLECISQCVTNGLVAPEWLADEFNRRYVAVLRCRASSWDSPLSFGRPYKKGTNINARRKERKGQLQVYIAVRDKLQKVPETKIDKGLFEEVGAALGYGATLAEEYFYNCIKTGFPHPRDQYRKLPKNSGKTTQKK